MHSEAGFWCGSLKGLLLTLQRYLLWALPVTLAAEKGSDGGLRRPPLRRCSLDFNRFFLRKFSFFFFFLLSFRTRWWVWLQLGNDYLLTPLSHVNSEGSGDPVSVHLLLSVFTYYKPVVCNARRVVDLWFCTCTAFWECDIGANFSLMQWVGDL